MRILLPLIVIGTITALVIAACQPRTSTSSGSGGGAPAPAPATSTSSGPPSSTAKEPLYNGNFDAVDFTPGQRVNCDNLDYPLRIRADGTLKWRAFAVTDPRPALGRVIDEVHVDPAEGMLAAGQTATLHISGAITTILPPPSSFDVMVEYANLPGAGHSFEFHCAGR